MNHHYWERIRSFARSDLADYDLHVFIYKIAHALISIFVPVLLYTIGYSLFQIVFYMFVNHLAKPVFTYASSPVAERIGIRNTMLIGLMFGVMHYGLFYFINSPDLMMLGLLAVTAWLYNGFYWGPQRAIIMPALPKKKIAFNLAGISFFRFSSSIVSPLIGAAIIILFGKNAIVAVAGLLMLLSIIPLYRMHNNDFKRKIGLLELLRKKQHRRVLVGMFFIGMMEHANNTLWPLFIFIALRDVATVGLVGSLLHVVTILTAFGVGKLSDAHRGKALFLVSGLAIALTLFVRTLWPTTMMVLVITVIYGLFKEGFSLPTYAMTYGEGKKKYRAEYSLLMELAKHAGKALMLLPFLFFLRFEVPFAIAGLACVAWGVLHAVWWDKQ